jgi:hypothetical protein
MTNCYPSQKLLYKIMSGAMVLMAGVLKGQEPRVFTTADFNLLGEVKRCLVITDYGKEAFDFNREGKLTKITTVYSESDYDITYYRYKKGMLSEKRLENYREDRLDRQTSLAHLYSADTAARKIVKEQIYSYQKEFLDQFEYTYDEMGNLIALTRTSNEGIDDTRISYDTLKGEATKTIEVNGIVDQSVRTAEIEEKGQVLSVELTRLFLKGDPYRAVEIFRDTVGRKTRETEYAYDPEKGSFVRSSETLFDYGEKGFLKSKLRKEGKRESKQEFIYQYDAHEPPNWIKEIITPANTYTTRRITYYQEEPAADTEGTDGGN